MKKLAVLVAMALCVACAGVDRHLPEGVDPAKRDWYGEFYNLEEYAKCKAQDRNPANTACEYLRLTRVEEPEYWPYPNVPKLKLPEAPNPPVYRSGMTSKEYFDALCKAEAGNFVFRTAEGVEGLYQVRPRKVASHEAIRDRYVLEDPYGYSNAEATRAAFIFVNPPWKNYRFFESPNDQAGGKFGRWEGYVQDKAPMMSSATSDLRSRYGYTWRGIKRPNDREMGIAGGETIVVDLSTNEVMAIRRGFIRSGFVRNVRSGIQWEIGETCPQIRDHPNSRDKFDDFAYAFVTKVLRPR
jgi:hypothetical protein